MTQGAKPVLAVDVDDVLFPLAPLLVEYNNKHHGSQLTTASFTSYVIEDTMGVSVDEFKKRMHHFGDLGTFTSGDPVEQSTKAISVLAQHFDLVVITSRWPAWEHETIEWLQRHFPDAFGQIHFTSHETVDGRAKGKSVICKEIGASILIDDSLDNLVSCAEVGVRGILFGDYAWNQADVLPGNIQRVKDWNEALEVLL